LSKHFISQISADLQNRRRGCDWMKRLTTYMLYILNVYEMK